LIFLIESDRPGRRAITRDTFDDSDFERAKNARLELELSLNRAGTDHEVVLLQASSEDALRQTHRRYFEDMKELIRHTAEASS